MSEHRRARLARAVAARRLLDDDLLTRTIKALRDGAWEAFIASEFDAPEEYSRRRAAAVTYGLKTLVDTLQQYADDEIMLRQEIETDV